MFAPVDWSRVEGALVTPKGWADLGLVAVCLGIAYLVDRRVVAARGDGVGQRRLHGGVARVLFPLVALVLVAIAAVLYQRLAGPPLFLAIAGPMLVALAAIRTIVYGLRRLFKAHGWVRTSERAIAFAIWALVVLHFLGAFPEMAATLDAVVIPVGKTRVSLLSIATAIVVVVFTLIATLWVSGMIEQRLARATQLDVNHRIILGKFVRAVLLFVGVLIALQAVGFDLTLLSVFGGALGVGIGLGLQKLASNYIAGFTILIDRSIRLGDMVTVDGRYGTVSNVTSRYVVVRGLDGVEAIVPNETLVTTTVLNHSYTTGRGRVPIAVQITYDSDVECALALMEEVAGAQPRALKVPDPPKAFLASFGDSGIRLEMVVWVNDPESGLLNLQSAINRGILAAFGKQGIRLSAPQRELRIVGMPAPPAGPQEEGGPSVAPQGGGGPGVPR